MLNAGMVLNGCYEITKVVGKGGMSTVYQAKDLNNHNLLAIKDVERSGKADNEVVEQSLVGEGKMLMQLSNPHLPRIYDIIENPENFMLVMDFIEGESLDKLLAREGAQPMERVLNWGMQICEVFHYLHNQPTPIIYRDMKPANVILQPDGKLMMIDFGTARVQKVGVNMSADTICIGTAGFAAPEQFGGIGQSDARTDIFCLGATLYNMITGHSPCDRPMGILPLEQWNPALGGTPIAEIIYKCTRNDPNERYQTAMELHEDLRGAAAGTYRKASGRGKSAQLHKQDWQKQHVVGGLSGGLSGLLQRGKGQTGFFGAKEEKSEPKPTPAPAYGAIYSNNGWNKSEPVAVAVDPVVLPPDEVYRQPEEEPDQLWHTVMLIGILVAAIFAVLAAVLGVLGLLTAAIVFLIIAFGAAALAIVGVVRGKSSS